MHVSLPPPSRPGTSLFSPGRVSAADIHPSSGRRPLDGRGAPASLARFWLFGLSQHLHLHTPACTLFFHMAAATPTRGSASCMHTSTASLPRRQAGRETPHLLDGGLTAVADAPTISARARVTPVAAPLPDPLEREGLEGAASRRQRIHVCPSCRRAFPFAPRRRPLVLVDTRRGSAGSVCRFPGRCGAYTNACWLVSTYIRQVRSLYSGPASRLHG